MMLSDVCLSVAYIGPKSRRERPRKTKIAYFQGQKVKVTGGGAYCGGLRPTACYGPAPQAGALSNDAL